MQHDLSGGRKRKKGPIVQVLREKRKFSRSRLGVQTIFTSIQKGGCGAERERFMQKESNLGRSKLHFAQFGRGENSAKKK